MSLLREVFSSGGKLRLSSDPKPSVAGFPRQYAPLGGTCMRCGGLSLHLERCGRGSLHRLMARGRLGDSVSGGFWPSWGGGFLGKAHSITGGGKRRRVVPTCWRLDFILTYS